MATVMIAERAFARIACSLMLVALPRRQPAVFLSAPAFDKYLKEEIHSGADKQTDDAIAQAPIIVGVVALLLLTGCTGSVGLQPPTVAVGTPPGVTQLSSDAPEIPGGPPPMAPLPTLAMGSAPQAPPVKPVRSGTYTGVAWPMGSGGSCTTTREVSGFHVRGNAVRYGALRGTIDTQNGVQMTNGQTWIYGQFEGELFAGQMDVPGPRGGAGCTYQLNLSRIGP